MRFVAVCAALLSLSLSLSLSLTISARADPAVNDPFVWLEDVGGQRALE